MSETSSSIGGVFVEPEVSTINGVRITPEPEVTYTYECVNREQTTGEQIAIEYTSHPYTTYPHSLQFTALSLAIDRAIADEREAICELLEDFDFKYHEGDEVAYEAGGQISVPDELKTIKAMQAAIRARTTP